jgi:hypothetical protein
MIRCRGEGSSRHSAMAPRQRMLSRLAGWMSTRLGCGANLRSTCGSEECTMRASSAGSNRPSGENELMLEVLKGRACCKESSFQAASFAFQPRLRLVIEFIKAAAERGGGSCHDLDAARHRSLRRNQAPSNVPSQDGARTVGLARELSPSVCSTLDLLVTLCSLPGGSSHAASRVRMV